VIGVRSNRRRSLSDVNGWSALRVKGQEPLLVRAWPVCSETRRILDAVEEYCRQAPNPADRLPTTFLVEGVRGGGLLEGFYPRATLFSISSLCTHATRGSACSSSLVSVFIVAQKGSLASTVSFPAGLVTNGGYAYLLCSQESPHRIYVLGTPQPLGCSRVYPHGTQEGVRV
jgi:hypothetical protein